MDQVKETTKEKIMRVAARMFSEKGYDKVTTREIAKAIGINSASIYHHFSSKDDILKSLYRFYAEERIRLYPDLDRLLRLAETESPHEVLMETEYHFPEDTRGLLDQILSTAAREINADPESEKFIRDNIFDSIADILGPLLKRLIELGKIRPFDVDNFIQVVSYYCFGAAALNSSAFKQDAADYQAGMSFLFSVIVPVVGVK